MLSSLQRYNDYGLLLLRLVIAAIFLYHGHQKWGMWSAASGGMEGGMLLLFKTLSIVEPLGGVLLILGAMTRVSGLVLSIVMLGAIYMKSQVMGVGFAASQGTGWEFDLMMFTGCVMLVLEGAGKWSMDEMMCKKK